MSSAPARPGPVPQNARAAVHLLRPDPQDGMLTVVCGWAIPYVRGRRNISKDALEATCRACRTWHQKMIWAGLEEAL